MSTNRQKPRLNRYLFTETSVDSGAVNVLGTLVHPFPEGGEYVIEVSRGDELLGSRLLVVSDDYHAIQADVDLSTFGSTSRLDEACGCKGACGCEDQHYSCIRVGGFAVFHVGRGPGGYRVVVDALDDRRDPPGYDDGEDTVADAPTHQFDSTVLTEDDTFAAVLMRPGTYVMRNLETEAEGSVTVAYPDPDRGRGVRRESVTVRCTDGGFEPKSVDLHPAQGLVFRIEGPSRVEIELVEPHERATDDGGPVRVPNPRRPVVSDRGRTVTPRVDPGTLSTDELESTLESITNPFEVRAILAMERQAQKRAKAMRMLKARLQQFERAGREDESK
jgi:hypothetical protein